MRRVRSAAAGLLLAAALPVVLLTGCTSDPLADDYGITGSDGDTGNEVILEVPQADRGDPIEFTGISDQGTEVSRSDYDGQVLVVNFWYAACSPCRAEAADLAELATTYAGKGASFLGVNVYDDAGQSLAFAETFGVPYPSILDQTTGTARLAFAGEIPPNAVPTTFVLDAEGRIAARIVGQLQSKSILDTLIEDTIAETPAAGGDATGTVDGG